MTTPPPFFFFAACHIKVCFSFQSKMTQHIQSTRRRRRVSHATCNKTTRFSVGKPLNTPQKQTVDLNSENKMCFSLHLSDSTTVVSSALWQKTHACKECHMFHCVAPYWVSYLIFFPAALHSSVISNEAGLSRRLSGQCCVKSLNITRQSVFTDSA